MQNFVYRSSPILVAIVLAGCSSGSSTPEVTSLERLNIGTTQAAGETGANGQPFADEIALVNGSVPPGTGFDDAGQVLLLIGSGDDNEPVVINLENANYSFDRGDPDVPLDGALILEVNGENLRFEFPNRQPSPFLVAIGTDQTEYRWSPNTTGQFSSTNTISTIDDFDDENPLGLYAFGFETRPGFISLPTQGGTANYAGDINGIVGTEFGPSDLTGTINFAVTFDSLISGSAHVAVGGSNLAFDINETSIIGNGFSTTAELTSGCETGFTCTSNTQIGGAFYGPNGEEISGLVLIDETTSGVFEGSPVTSNAVGAAGFTAAAE